MHSHQTNFRAHQRQARKNSQRLTLAFVLGIIASAFAYFIVIQWLLEIPYWAIYGKGHINKNGTLFLVIALALTLIHVVIILWGFLIKINDLKNNLADEIAMSLGAKVLPKKRSLRQQQYVNVVEEMALASGVRVPIILYTPNDQSINGFVTGGYADEVAITVSQGALDYLNREELQALVAHEFGHIFNRDVFLNNRLSAVLYGFFFIKELMIVDKTYSDDEPNSDIKQMYWSDGNARHIVGYSPRFSVWGMAVIVISSVSIFFGKLLQAVFSRQREWLADAHAVQYTRNKDALARVFYKAMALQHMKVLTPPVADESVHFLFINYQSKWLSTHPPLEARIARYGKKPSQSELQAFAHKMKQRKHERELAEHEQAECNVQQNASPDAHKRFIAETFIPLLVLREYQQSLRQHPVSSPDEAVNAVLAQFVMIGNIPLKKIAQTFQWSKDKSTAIQQTIDALNEQHPSTHIQTFLHQLPMVHQYEEKQALTKQINTIIKSDRVFGLCEMCYLLCLRASLQEKPEESARQRDFKRHKSDVAHLLNIVAYISHEDDSGQASNFELMKADAMPMLNATYRAPSLNNSDVQALYQSIQRLSYVKATFRKNLLNAIEKNMFLDARLSTEQNHLLCALKYFLA